MRCGETGDTATDDNDARHWSPPQQTTVCWTNVVSRPAGAEKARWFVMNAFQHEVANHFNEGGMRSCGRGANHFHSQFLREVLRFVIEVVNNFHVIRDETDRRHDGVLNSTGVHLS